MESRRQMSMLFYTAASRMYWHFAPLYIYFILSANEDWAVEVGLEDAEDFKAQNAAALRVLNYRFAGRFKITDIDFAGRLPSAVRYLEEPTFERNRDFVYVGDIDILILDEDIEERHVANMAKNDLPFSNKLRPLRDSDAGRRLTGLQFAPMSLQYPLPDVSDLDVMADTALFAADEHVLYEMMRRKGVMVPETATFRPEHGIHISNGRHPFGRRKDGQKLSFDFEEIRKKNQSVAWSGIHKLPYREKLAQRLADPLFFQLFFELDIKARNLIMVLENIIAERFDDFFCEMQRYVTNIEQSTPS